VSSPFLIGHVSDWWGSLQAGLMLTTFATAVSGARYLMGARTLGADTERVARRVAGKDPSGLDE
jgi:hypothetical protein